MSTPEEDNETRLALARAYIDMHDADGSKELLRQVEREGTDAQRAEAAKLLKQWDRS